MSFPELLEFASEIAVVLIAFILSAFAFGSKIVQATPSTKDDEVLGKAKATVLDVIYRIESIVGQDLDGDGTVGKPTVDAIKEKLADAKRKVQETIK